MQWYNGSIDSLVNMYDFCTFIFSNEVFHNFSFSSFQLSCSNPFACTLLSIYLPVTLLSFSSVNSTKKSCFSWVELPMFTIANQSVSGGMNNQNTWKIIKIEKSNKYKWDRTNHSLNITRIILLLISHEMTITKDLSIYLEYKIRSYRMVL